MRIAVDTNVLISATFWKGASHQIISLAEQRMLDIVLSEEIIEEYKEVLDYKEIQEKIKNKNLTMKWSVQKIISLAEIVVPRERLQIIQEDPDDNKILECALAGDVDYIVSQDHHLLDIKSFHGIKIVSPEDFLKIFRGK